ncbi:MAG: TRAP transporter small permease [Methyloligellaceae bacterium]
MQNKDTIRNRLIRIVDIVAAVLLGMVTMLTFVSVLCRYVINWPIPDNFDIGRLLLGISVFWGIASATLRSEHIQVDILYETLAEKGKRILNIFATAFSSFFMFGIVWMVAGQVLKIRDGNETTTDLLIPIWPFYAVAWIGALLTIIILGIMLWSYFTSNEAE